MLACNSTKSPGKTEAVVEDLSSRSTTKLLEVVVVALTLQYKILKQVKSTEAVCIFLEGDRRRRKVVTYSPAGVYCEAF